MNWETDWLKSRSRLTPNREAIVDLDSGIRYTYEALHERVLRLAGFLQQSGIQKGDRVALLAPNHPFYFELLFACGKLGAIYIPLNYRLGIPELNYILSDCTPRILFYHPSMKDTVDRLEHPEIQTLRMDLFDTRDDYLDIGEPHVGLEDPYLIIYTGGTTGKPKGVVLSHMNVFWNSINTIISWGIRDSDITVTYLPLFHTGGLNALSLPVLHAGGTVIIGNKYDPVQAINIIEQEKCTILLLVPTMYHLMTQTKEFQQALFQHQPIFLSGGAPCPHSIYQQFKDKGLSFKEGYGLTEAGPNNFYISPEEARYKRGSVGKPMFHSMVKIVTDEGQEAAAEEVGELWIAGKHVFAYYLNKPQETIEAKPDHWLRTGDLAKRDEDGYYYIVGRKKDMIITGGENVYPQEIEHLLDQHPAIDEAIVLGLPDEKWGEIVTAVVVLKPGMSMSVEELKGYVAQHLGNYKVPKHVVFAGELLKTPIGKIDRKAIWTSLVTSKGEGWG